MGCLHSSEGVSSSKTKKKPTSDEDKKDKAPESRQSTVANRIGTRKFTVADLVSATEGFKDDNLLGEGGFGKVYRGKFKDSDQFVAIKKMICDGAQGNEEFDVEVSTLSKVDHPNLVKLVGYCVEADERLLVYEFMPLGSLDYHLHGVHPDRKLLDWNTRIKIAADAARGLAYLHNKMNPPIIFRDFKTSNILLGEEFHVKLSDFGMVKLGPVGDKTHVTTRVMGTYGYFAPEYAATGLLTVKCDIYSFGVVLLELITGRKAIDNTKPTKEQSLVSWAQPLIKDKMNYPQMVDPTLEGQYTIKGLHQAITISAICLSRKPRNRPTVSDVVRALDYVASQKKDPRRASDRAGTSGVENIDQGEG